VVRHNSHLCMLTQLGVYILQPQLRTWISANQPAKHCSINRCVCVCACMHVCALGAKTSFLPYKMHEKAETSNLTGCILSIIMSTSIESTKMAVHNLYCAHGNFTTRWAKLNLTTGEQDFWLRGLLMQSGSYPRSPLCQPCSQ
jgi:hypothetical protein